MTVTHKEIENEEGAIIMNSFLESQLQKLHDEMSKFSVEYGNFKIFPGIYGIKIKHRLENKNKAVIYFENTEEIKDLRAVINDYLEQHEEIENEKEDNNNDE